jgi:tetratricopeptide (TPR) repeat protein
MTLKWFDVREAVAAGRALAEQFASQRPKGHAAHEEKTPQPVNSREIQEILQRIDHEVRPLRLNFYKRAKFANSFKWRLLENGVEKGRADEVTQTLLLHLSLNQTGTVLGHNPSASATDRPDPSNARYLQSQGNKRLAEGAYLEAVTIYQDLVRHHPPSADVLNNLGAAFCKLGHYGEAEDSFRLAIEITPGNPEVHCNLGNVLRWTGRIPESEILLRRALKLKPNYVDARASLGLTLMLLGRLRDAKARFEKVLKASPRHVDALFGMGQVAMMEGRFDEADTMFKRVLEVRPKMPNAWAALAGTRKMTPADNAWLMGAEEIAASGVTPLEEAGVRFAIGKYCDDVEKYETAFRSYKRGNELLKATAEDYEREAKTHLVDDLIRVYSRETFAHIGGGISASKKPVFVVGMLRSGTSLTEQILSSHPFVKGAGELAFWGDAVREHESAIRQGLLDEPLRKKLAEAYLRILAEHSSDAERIVDKAPTNADHLGLIHTVFPDARIIYMQRDPIDTCLSCYFQQFSTSLNFTMDLSDLAHYYREHQRLMAHWRSVLPPGTILDVPYAELVADQEGWTRKILDFLGLEWDERCLDFHNTKRSVVTASAWQVRQKIYKDSVERWRNYERFIGPLLGLRDLDRN